MSLSSPAAKVGGCFFKLSLKSTNRDDNFITTFLSLITEVDLQNVNITLRILFRPIPSELPKLYSSLGEDYDERVLPSITNEILKAVVVSR